MTSPQRSQNILVRSQVLKALTENISNLISAPQEPENHPRKHPFLLHCFLCALDSSCLGYYTWEHSSYESSSSAQTHCMGQPKTTEELLLFREDWGSEQTGSSGPHHTHLKTLATLTTTNQHTLKLKHHFHASVLLVDQKISGLYQRWIEKYNRVSYLFPEAPERNLLTITNPNAAPPPQPGPTYFQQILLDLKKLWRAPSLE